MIFNFVKLKTIGLENLNRTGRIFYGVAIAATGIQQFFFPDFFQILFPPLPFAKNFLFYFSQTVGAFLFVAGTAIALNIRIRQFAYSLVYLFLFFFIFCYIPYELFISPYSPIHLGLWINPLKELAYAGGALIAAGQYPVRAAGSGQIPKWTRVAGRFTPYGRIFFSITMISFGISHFYYAETVAGLVPDWMPGHIFWTYFAGVALFGSGIAIMLKYHVYKIGNLLALMIFLWFILLHIPRALANPAGDNGNEITSAFSALAFSGIALMIANGGKVKKEGDH